MAEQICGQGGLVTGERRRCNGEGGGDAACAEGSAWRGMMVATGE